MHIGELTRMANEVEKQLEYYKNLVIEQKEIIEQLTGTGQPRDYFYMHPMDVGEEMSKATFHMNFSPYLDVKKLADNELIMHGRRIKQSPHIPVTTKVFKLK